MMPPRPLPRQRTFINLLFLFYFSTNCFVFAQALDEQGSRRLTECGLGSSPAGHITGQLQDASSVRIRDDDNNSPTFDSEGVVSGRAEVYHDGQWGTVATFEGDSSDNTQDAAILCRQLATELGVSLLSSSRLSWSSTPSGSGKIWLSNTDSGLSLFGSSSSCSGAELTLDACPSYGGWGNLATWAGHEDDIGITCKFDQSDECEACPAGKFSDTVDTSPCTSCEAGRYSSTPSATACLACEAGKASSTTGATSESTVRGRKGELDHRSYLREHMYSLSRRPDSTGCFSM
ncbi:hypothetical protein TrST_g4530 [Triparma strigata]|uniref:SRCR domain-containing protein n=1 Tax=Triparma strigata TaxID=1606541 RepID=A0A9W7E133_9STRA|nr:hypothetical protein TrST_g4530 [Triparma strigata]